MNVYSDYFSTCYTPEEMARMGVFGGAYFSEPAIPPSEWLRQLEATPEIAQWLGLRRLGKPDYKANRYKTRAGLTYAWWKAKGLIRPQDPYGWYQWYINYHFGRRTADDARQIQRFRSLVGRQWSQLSRRMGARGEPMSRAGELYPRACQALLQWGWDPSEDPVRHMLHR